MKVLFNMHPAGFQTRIFGGAQVQLLKTKEYLKKKGINVKNFDMYDDKVEDFDIFHNFEMNRDTYMLYSQAKEQGVKIALSSIYWAHTNMLLSEDKLKSIGKLTSEKLAFWESSLNPFFKLYPYKSFLKMADIILPNSQMEAEHISKRFKIDIKKFHVVPNGVDKKFADAKPELFVEEYGIKDFVLFVGRIDPRKNILKFIRAVKCLDLPAVIIGHTSSYHENYLKLCKKEAEGTQIKFLGSFKPESKMLMSAYAACKVLALPSWFETPGLVALEAGLAGANIAISSGGSTTEYFKDYAQYCNPKNQSSITRAIKNAYDKEKNDRLRKHILKNFTWEKVAKKTLEAYKKIL